MTDGACLVLGRQVVRGARRTLPREGMALQAQEIHLHNTEKTRIGGTVRRVATRTAFGLYRDVFVDEGALFIYVALVTNGVSTGQSPDLP